jgi:hypothetical protein
MRAILVPAAITLVLALTLLVAGCGDDDDSAVDPTDSLAATPTAESTPAGNPILDSPCQLLTAEEVSRVFGETYTLVQDNNPCAYTALSGAQPSQQLWRSGCRAILRTHSKYIVAKNSARPTAQSGSLIP